VAKELLHGTFPGGGKQGRAPLPPTLQARARDSVVALLSLSHHSIA
jgi:hypothetical protein